MSHDKEKYFTQFISSAKSRYLKADDINHLCTTYSNIFGSVCVSTLNCIIYLTVHKALFCLLKDGIDYTRQ